MRKNGKRLLSALLAIGVLATCAGCGAGNASDDGVDLREMLTSLIVRDDQIGLAGKYAALSDIPDGKADPALVGTWICADGTQSCTFGEDGSKTTAGETTPFTCIEAEGYHILCEEDRLTTYADDGTATQEVTMRYTAYRVQDDALYTVGVESVGAEGDAASFTLIPYYKADTERKQISLATLAGTWIADNGELRFNFKNSGVSVTGGKAHFGRLRHDASFNEKGQLEIELNGTSTAYDTVLTFTKTYLFEDKESVSGEAFRLSLSYTGADENDKPNLVDVMTDRRTEYGYDAWVYNVDLTLSDAAK